MIDADTGYRYVVQMKNGNLVSFSMCTGISIANPPNITSYVEGDEFDPTGMVVIATCEDGTTKEITNYSYPSLVPKDGVTITYVEEDGTLHTAVVTDLNITSMEDILIDFTYVTNGDGTYTITDWKSTLNGTYSTECVIPDYKNIIL
jgi:hypothetical protein